MERGWRNLSEVEGMEVKCFGGRTETKDGMNAGQRNVATCMAENFLDSNTIGDGTGIGNGMKYTHSLNLNTKCLLV